MMFKKKQKNQEPQDAPDTQTPPESKLEKTKETVQSTQAWSPIADVRDGIVITKNGGYTKIMEFSPNNLLLRNANEQDAIADYWGSIIRILPNSFHIKILTKKANLSHHIQKMEGYIKQEENEKCRAMQYGTIRLLEESAMQSISRRFFLAFSYEGGSRLPLWSEVVNSLEEQARQVEAMLRNEPTCNEPLAPAGDTEYVKEILYSILCRKESEHKTMDERNFEVFQRYLDIDNHSPVELAIPVNDFICPSLIDPSDRKFLQVDGMYYAFAYIPGSAYDTGAFSGWLAQYIGLNEGIDVDIWVSKDKPERVQQKLIYAMRLNKQRVKDTEDTSMEFDSVIDQVQAGYYIRNQMSNRQDLCYFSLMFTICEQSKEVLAMKVDWLKDVITRSGLSIVPIMYIHLDAFAATLPINEPPSSIVRKARRNIMSSDLGSAYPFVSYEMDDADGIYVGKSLESGSPTFLAPYNRNLYDNGNIGIFGRSGSGKTYLEQCLALRLRQQEVQVIIIVPKKGEDYYRACRAIDGQIVVLAPGSAQNINLMEIRKIDYRNNAAVYGSDMTRRSRLAAKIQQLARFIKICLPDITTVERQIFEEACNATYKAFGITERNKSLIDPANPNQYKPMPIFGDLYRTMEKMKGSERLCAALHPYVYGSAKSFNAQTNVNLNNKYVLMDLSHATPDTLNAIILIATDYINDVITADVSQRKAVFFDELWAMIGASGTTATAEFVLDVFKTIRARNAIAVAATQDLKDYDASTETGRYGLGILNAINIKFIMRLEPTEVATISDALALSQAELLQIGRYRRGEGLLVARQNHINIHVVASPEENALITTDPEEIKKILNAQRR